MNISLKHKALLFLSIFTLLLGGCSITEPPNYEKINNVDWKKATDNEDVYDFIARKKGAEKYNNNALEIKYKNFYAIGFCKFSENGDIEPPIYHDLVKKSGGTFPTDIFGNWQTNYKLLNYEVPIVKHNSLVFNCTSNDKVLWTYSTSSMSLNLINRKIIRYVRQIKGRKIYEENKATITKEYLDVLQKQYEDLIHNPQSIGSKVCKNGTLEYTYPTRLDYCVGGLCPSNSSYANPTSKGYVKGKIYAYFKSYNKHNELLNLEISGWASDKPIYNQASIPKMGNVTAKIGTSIYTPHSDWGLCYTEKEFDKEVQKRLIINHNKSQGDEYIGTSLTPTVRISPRMREREILKGITGFVTLSFDVDEQGGVENIQVVNSKPSRTFDREVIRAFKKWKYEPLIENGIAKKRTGLKIKILMNDL